MSLYQMGDEALRLPEPDRAVLAAALLESLAPETRDDATDWDAEPQRRIAELDRGRVVPIP